MIYANQLSISFFINFDSITAFNTLTRAAKYIETKKPEAAVQFYKKAADLYKMEGGRIREAADVLGRVFVLFFILFFLFQMQNFWFLSNFA